MLGWEIFIRKFDSNVEISAINPTIVSWTAGVGGLKWIDEMVKEGRAQDLGGSGYPYLYTARAADLFSRISFKPQTKSGPTVLGDDYFYEAGMITGVTSDEVEIKNCPPDQRLLIEAWDQS